MIAKNISNVEQVETSFI